ncbi:MAG: adenylate/guanylate cyclase domain-containing protein [Treponema sp.]
MTIHLTYKTDQIAADKISAEISSYGERELFHIDVYALAKKLGLSCDRAIGVFIQGVVDGFFTLDWVYHCPICGGVAHETLSIHQAKTENYCPACKKDFCNTLDDNIEVFFSIHPSVKQLDESLRAEYSKNIMDDVMSGRYLSWKKPNAIRGIDLIQNNVYRDLMGGEVLISDQSLKIMKVTILFTDIKGSTQMYTDLGDARAFQLVREHFNILFDTIKEFGGVPVKTIGDAVMGAFLTPKDAVDATLEAQKRLINHYAAKPKDERIEVKIGVHSGPALIVTLNNKLDYFGSTINMAARIQASARPNEVAVSEELYKDKEIQRSILAVTKTVRRQHTAFKGLDGEYDVYHIPLQAG